MTQTEVRRESYQGLIRPDDHTAVLAVYQEKGLAQAARETGVPKSTIARWAKQVGLDRPQITIRASRKMRAVAEAYQASMAERRAWLAKRLLREAEIELSRLRQPILVHAASAGKVVEWTESEPSPSDRQKIVTAAAILLDKSQLLSGQATSRTESMSAEEARKMLETEFGELLKVVDAKTTKKIEAA